jgi:uncharacterized BrkB/YihY/UPF0761 family membrane protein
MSDPQNPIPRGSAGPASGRRRSVASVLVMLVGIVLLLPGLCWLYFLIPFDISEPQNLDQIPGVIWIIWGVCFLVAIVGGLLIRMGWRG